MKRIFVILSIVLIASAHGQSQVTSNKLAPLRLKESAFQSGEWFQFRIHYGIFNASYATLEVKEKNLDGKDVFHVKGYGRTTGLARLFFRVEDHYESYFDKATGRPYKFVRNIDEGGYTKDIEINFDQSTNTAHVNDKKHKQKTSHAVGRDVQDLLSAFYYLRNNYDISDIKVGESIELDMFFDKETFKFKLKYLGKETIRTKFGKVESLKFRPYVQAGRVFKEQESLTLWVSNDKNKIPLRIKADIAVGSIKADLNAFKGLKHSFKIKVKK
ncbi:DUF3108 domain-containing protein [Sungkyunkwania multivorans]|uniref:DUF3108 domain-containing protein n=1 Tax=Sungkyunkwania multivorans TaxID=1173618 RepID=A0ABW3CZR5_9FLAO